MKKIILFAFLLPLILWLFFQGIGRNGDLPKRNHNVCKKLTGEVQLYIVWVETRESYNWDNYDISTTLDSINLAVRWIEGEARKNNIKVSIGVDYFQNDTLKSINQNLRGNVKRILQKPEGVEEIGSWTNRIVKRANGSKNKGHFIADLREKRAVESVALMFFVNNYHRSDYAFSLNTDSEEDVEYSVLSTKNPVLIAQELLHLFGAAYLYPHASIKDKRNKETLQSRFPNDIMANTERHINELEIGPATKYQIGWSEQIEPETEKILQNEKSRF
jgi:hypothetical protein